MAPPNKKVAIAAVPTQLTPRHNSRSDGSNMSLLLEYVRKDPESYAEEFGERLTHFLELNKLIRLQPTIHRMEVNPMIELTTFLASSAYCYPEKARIFTQSVTETLSLQGDALEPDLRMALTKAIVTMRHHNMIELESTLQLFFELVKCDDKQLRKFVQGALISFIRKHHRKVKRADSKMQAYVFARLKEGRAVVVRVAQLTLIEAFRRGFWKDAKTANAISGTIFNKTPKVQVAGIRFFLGTSKDEQGDESGSDDDDDENAENKDTNKSLRAAQTAFRHGKKTKKRQKQLEEAKKEAHKEKTSKKDKHRQQCNLAAIHLLFDPQALADRVFSLLEGKRNERYTLKLLLMALVAKLIGIHRLQTLGFYSYLHKYLQPKQREVTRILLYAAQACHDRVPTDIVHDLVYCIAQNFVSDRNSPEAMTVGLNAIREVFVNVPEAASKDLLDDLTEYRKYNNKNVSMAARGLIQLFRVVNPEMLRAKDRGRPPKKDKADESEDEDEEMGVDSDEEAEDEEASDEEDVIRPTNDEQMLEEATREVLEKREDTDRLASLNDIMHMHKKTKQSKSERLEQIKEGRSDRDAYKKRKKNGPHVGRTNAMIAKNKTFAMTRHKMRGKNRQRSFREQQISLRNYLIRQTGKKVQ